MGPVCLLARAMDGGVSRTAVEGDRFEYAVDRNEPSERVLPGVLRFGGLRAAAALAAPGPLLLHHTGGALDPAWARRLPSGSPGRTPSSSAPTTRQST